MAFDPQKIEEKIDRVVGGAVVVSDQVGGVLFQNMAEVMEFAKMLSVAGTAVRKHLRNNPGACLAITIQAIEWKMSPVAVANKSYEVNDQIAYEAQLIAALIHTRAPLQRRPRYVFNGEGDQMSCTVSGLMKGEIDPLEYSSPPIGKIVTKNSPLWRSDPQQQLGFYSIRAWARRYCPEVVLGIYSEDELRDSEIGADHARDVTPKPDISARLAKKPKSDGFHPENIDRALERKPGEALPQAKERASEPVLASQEGAQAPSAEHRAAEPPAEEPGPGTLSEAEKAARGAALAGARRQELAAQEAKAEKPASKAFTDASTTVEAYGKQLEQGEIADLDEFKKLCRIAIDNFEGITDDERDILRGRFSGYLLAAQKKQAGRGKRK